MDNVDLSSISYHDYLYAALGVAKEEMKAGIYDPYLDTLGGGERYVLAVANCWLKRGWNVNIFWEKVKFLLTFWSQLTK